MALTPITIVGCGPGSPDYLTRAAEQAIAGARILVGSSRLLSMFPNAGLERIAVTADIQSLLDRLACATQPVTVLVSGDPGVFSLASNIIGRFGRKNCRIIPGISSVQVAFARLGLDWVDAHIISAHGRFPALCDLSRHRKIAILIGTPEAQKWAASAILERTNSHVGYLCENLTLPDERVRQITSEELDAVAASSLSIVLLIHRSLVQ